MVILVHRPFVLLTKKQANKNRVLAFQTNFQHQGFQCSIVGASYVPDEEAEGDTVDIPTILANSSTEPPIYESLKASR